MQTLSVPVNYANLQQLEGSGKDVVVLGDVDLWFQSWLQMQRKTMGWILTKFSFTILAERTAQLVELGPGRLFIAVLQSDLDIGQVMAAISKGAIPLQICVRAPCPLCIRGPITLMAPESTARLWEAFAEAADDAIEMAKSHEEPGAWEDLWKTEDDE